MEEIAVISSKRLNLVYLLTNFKKFFFSMPPENLQKQEVF